MTFFDDPRNSSGSLASIVNNSPTRLSSFMGTGMGTFVASLSTLVGGAIVGLVYSWKLGLVNIVSTEDRQGLTLGGITSHTWYRNRTTQSGRCKRVKA